MTDIAEEYRSSLSELNFNSKPHINMLTMLAEENVVHAPVIVKAIVDHINSVTPDVKLPSLYLVDSIVKNVGKVYISLFSKHLVSLFTSVFEKVDENIRSLLYKLRSTWTGIFPNTVLLHLDKSVVCLDPAWPILAKPQIHFNPKFFKDKPPSVQLPQKVEPAPAPQNALLQEVEMKKQELVLLQALHQKKKELISLQLKAALNTPLTVIEPTKDDSKKTINARDPRLSKKVSSASSGSDSVLQSVVVVPKANTNKRSDKDSTSTASKKIKLDTASSPKKDFKSKNSNSLAPENNAKLNTSHSVQSNSSKPAQSLNTQKDSKNKKQSHSHENSVKTHSELDKSNKVPLTSLEQNIESSKCVVQKNMNSFSEKSHELKKNNFVPETSLNEENKYQFKPEPVMTNEEISSKTIQKLEPPPPPPHPLFLGNEDKDYRILPKTVNDERSVNESAYPKRVTVPVVKSFILDKKERKVYFVNDRSFAFMDDNVPRELTFEGPPRLVFIEGVPQPIELHFGQEIKFDIDGKTNYMKFGTPSREVYINDLPYEAQFGGLPLTAVLSDDKVHRIHISGPSPQVVLSESPAYELYERFCQNNQEFLRRFDSEPNISNNNISSDIHVGTQDVDMRVNNVKFPSTFFDFPLEKMNDVDWQKVHVGNSQQTEWNAPKNSFETLKDMQPNFVSCEDYPEHPDWASLPDMQNTPMNPPPLPPKQIINRFSCLPPPPLPPLTFNNINKPSVSVNQFPLNEHPVPVPSNNIPFSRPGLNKNEFDSVQPELNTINTSNIPRLSPPPLPPFLGAVPNTSCMTAVRPVSVSAPYNNTIVRTPLLPLPVNSAPILNLPPLQSVTRLAAPLPVNNFAATTEMPTYSVPENVPKFTSVSTSIAATSVATNDMQLFMEKLKAAGLISSDNTTSTPASTTTVTSEPEKKDDDEEFLIEETIPEITFDTKCLKEFHSGVIAAIYSGSQCATCGMRFKEIQSIQYSRHLDWHFRRNRREKDGAKKPFSRRWFYEIKDWIEFKEFEDVDERAPSYFELQANNEQIDEIPENVCSVSCSECDSEKCAVCSEQFQLFWIEEEEEWHLRNAVKHDDQVYHPACYEDYKKASESTTTDAETSFEETAIDTKSDVEALESSLKTETKAGDSCIIVEKDDIDIKSENSVEEMDIDIKKEVEEMDIDIKKEVEGMDIDIKKEVEEMDIDIKKEVEEMDDDIKIDAKESNQLEENIQPSKPSQIKDKKIEEATNVEKMESKDIVEEKIIENEVKSDVKKTECISTEDAKTEEVVKDEKETTEKASECVSTENAKSEEVVNDEKEPVEKKIHCVSTEDTKSEEVVVNDEKEATEEKTECVSTEDTKTEKVVNGEKEAESSIKEELKADVKENESIIKEITLEKEMKTVTTVSESVTEESIKNKEVACDKNMNSNIHIVTSESPDVTLTNSDKVDEKPQLSSQTESVPVKSDESFDDIEFRPPTPDPRFQNLPPVSKGTEISNLCIIM